MGDVAGAMGYLRSLPYTNGKIGLFGTCSGGRHAYLSACRLPDVDAIVDCWGGRLGEDLGVSGQASVADIN